VAESHLSIHSWPEYEYAAIDVFTCGADINLDAAIQKLGEYFKWSHTEQQTINRGMVDKFT
ncbi:S-adenosylmethionine decarboxylase family protein, partial [Klebsiella pneumoniae]|uniref:S-adenosylmethionine decarboxylase family protein n=1 Tax=Klebsiella pneumoniae TaxID=573 RepID=UPI0038552B17